MPSSSTLIRRDKVFISDNMNKVALIKALRKHGLTATKVIKPIVEALEATRTVVVGSGEEAFADNQPDHATRMRAAQLGIELLGLKNNKEVLDSDEPSKLFLDALKTNDEIKLQQIVFNKRDNEVEKKLVENKAVKSKLK